MPVSNPQSLVTNYTAKRTKKQKRPFSIFMCGFGQ